MIIKDNKKIKMYYGNCRPVRVMKNNKLLGGWKKTGMSSGEAEFNHTFNDVITLHGRGANIPAESKSGEIITADNVYELEHTLNCYLTSDTITDFSGVNVSRYGKNLLDYTKATDRLGNPLTIIENGVLWDNQISYWFNIPCFVPKGTTIIFTCKSDFEENFDSIADVNFECEDGTVPYIGVNSPHTLTSNLVNLRVQKSNSGVVDNPIKITNLQLEVGQTATDYEPYVFQTVTANSDGSVEGLTSLSPNMTIMTDTEGTVINVQYFKSLSSESLPPSPDNIRPIVGAKGKITVTSREGDYYETQCPELFAVEVEVSAPHNYTETVDGVKKYYITDTLEGNKLTRRVGKIVLRSVDGWTNYETSREKDFVLQNKGLYAESLDSSYIGCFCNYFQGKTRYKIYSGDEGISISSNYIRVSQGYSDVFGADVGAFKSFLEEKYSEGNPIVLYYALAEPVIENIENYPKSLPFYTHVKAKTQKGYLHYGMQDCIKVSN